MTAKSKSISFILLSSAFAGGAQLIWKAGSMTIEGGGFSYLWNPFFLLGGLVYLGATFFMMKALQKEEFSKIMPMLSFSYVWVILLSFFIFPTEQLGMMRWIGICMITIGVWLLMSDKAEKKMP